MDLYRLGRVSWLHSQLVYHALPRLGREGLILCRPAEPYVSVGYHQDLHHEVDLAYCRERSIPVFRREVGGGTVYLDGHQLFYQLVLGRRNPLAPLDRGRFFRTFLGPVVRTLGEWGLDARLEPPCDLHVGGRKISGNAAGDVEGSSVLVGNLFLDVDHDRLADVLRLPSEGLRALVGRRMEAHVTSLTRELGAPPPVEEVAESLARNFSDVLPDLSPADVDDELVTKVSELEGLFTSGEWLFEPGRRTPWREVKIAEGTYVYALPMAWPDGPGEVLLVAEGGRVCEVRTAGFAPAAWRRCLGCEVSPSRLREWLTRGGPPAEAGRGVAACAG
ncbi:MAG: lipoate--protein ligase family protein [Deltaproteobacteria bacterium]|nr:lipoate--protein ligase family protein [Deltaproteobacteria bacterium]